MSLKKVVRNFIAKYQEKFCLNNYKKILTRVQNKKGKIRVLFLVRENQKWSYQSLYELLEKDEKFEPLVVVSILEIARKGKDKTRQNIDETYRFFRSRGMETEFAYKKGKYVDLREFNPDIIFYDQPWDLPKIHQPQEVSKFALTCYASYSYELLNNRDDYTPSFHRLLNTFFVEDKINLERYESYKSGNKRNCIIVGYPKLDNYFQLNNKISQKNDEFKIIYAPHHSLEKNGLQLATIRENGKFILELAKNNPQTTWIFKPHPRLKYAMLKNGYMTEDKINAYYKEWEKIGYICNEGNYLEIFQSTDLMITDCCSFLAEYLPTGKPLIRLINHHAASLNKLGEKICSGYYYSDNNKELESLFKQLVIEKNDCKKTLRENLITEILDKNKTSSEKIIEHFNKILEI